MSRNWDYIDARRGVRDVARELVEYSWSVKGINGLLRFTEVPVDGNYVFCFFGATVKSEFSSEIHHKTPGISTWIKSTVSGFGCVLHNQLILLLGHSRGAKAGSLCQQVLLNWAQPALSRTAASRSFLSSSAGSLRPIFTRQNIKVHALQHSSAPRLAAQCQR
jgi:hypothetical protein